MRLNFKGIFGRKNEASVLKKGRSGNKLARRMSRRKAKEDIRQSRILNNQGKATRPGTLQGGKKIPWNRF